MERRSSLGEARFRRAFGGRAAVVVLGLCALFALRVPPAVCQEAIASGARRSGSDVVLPPPAGGAAKFRFLPDGPWIRYDRELRLCAAEGEMRAYSLEVDAGEGDSAVTDYLIDKRRPAPPSAEPQGGLFHGPVSPELRCEAGSQAFWALFGPEAFAPAFVPYGPDSRPALPAPRSGLVTYTLVAYVEDEAGNRSAPERFVYRIAEIGIDAALPAQDAAPPALNPDARLEPPTQKSSPGQAELALALPEGAEFLVAVNPPRRRGPSAISSASKRRAASPISSSPAPTAGREGSRSITGYCRAASPPFRPMPSMWSSRIPRMIRP